MARNIFEQDIQEVISTMVSSDFDTAKYSALTKKILNWATQSKVRLSLINEIGPRDAEIETTLKRLSREVSNLRVRNTRIFDNWSIFGKMYLKKFESLDKPLSEIMYDIRGCINRLKTDFNTITIEQEVLHSTKNEIMVRVDIIDMMLEQLQRGVDTVTENYGKILSDTLVEPLREKKEDLQVFLTLTHQSNTMLDIIDLNSNKLMYKLQSSISTMKTIANSVSCVSCNVYGRRLMIKELNGVLSVSKDIVCDDERVEPKDINKLIDKLV